jgi:hypothetical protein
MDVWLKFASDASVENMQALRDTRLKVELFLKEING